MPVHEVLQFVRQHCQVKAAADWLIVVQVERHTLVAVCSDGYGERVAAVEIAAHAGERAVDDGDPAGERESGRDQVQHTRQDGALERVRCLAQRIGVHLGVCREVPDSVGAHEPHEWR